MPIDRNDGWTLENGDEEVNADIEEDAHAARAVVIPSKLKAVIKFGYDDGMKDALGGQDFDTYIAGVMTHTQAHYRHAASLGTTIEFEVCESKFIYVCVLCIIIPLKGYFNGKICRKSFYRSKVRPYIKLGPDGLQMII